MPPLAGGKLRREYRESLEGKTHAIAAAALGRLVCSGVHVRSAVAHRPDLFGALLSLIRTGASGGGGGHGGGGGAAGAGTRGRADAGRARESPPAHVVAVACSVFCLARVLTDVSAGLLSRAGVLEATVALSELLEARLDAAEGHEGQRRHGGPDALGAKKAGTSPGSSAGSVQRLPPPTEFLWACAAAALWGCLSRYRGEGAFGGTGVLVLRPEGVREARTGEERCSRVRSLPACIGRGARACVGSSVTEGSAGFARAGECSPLETGTDRPRTTERQRFHGIRAGCVAWKAQCLGS